MTRHLTPAQRAELQSIYRAGQINGALNADLYRHRRQDQSAKAIVVLFAMCAVVGLILLWRMG